MSDQSQTENTERNENFVDEDNLTDEQILALEAEMPDDDDEIDIEEELRQEDLNKYTSDYKTFLVEFSISAQSEEEAAKVAQSLVTFHDNIPTEELLRIASLVDEKPRLVVDLCNLHYLAGRKKLGMVAIVKRVRRIFKRS
ncbi:MAG: hypothetical protein AAF599_00035 [Bacteroidota bacterium]